MEQATTNGGGGGARRSRKRPYTGSSPMRVPFSVPRDFGNSRMVTVALAVNSLCHILVGKPDGFFRVQRSAFAGSLGRAVLDRNDIAAALTSGLKGDDTLAHSCTRLLGGD